MAARLMSGRHGMRVTRSANENGNARLYETEFRVAARLLAVALSALLLSYVAVRLLLEHQIRRASAMLAKVQSLNVGDSEESIKPLVKRYGGFRWDTQLGTHEDYNYVIEINPSRFPTLRNFNSVPIAPHLNARLRRALGLRYWMMFSEIAIKKQQVAAVQAELCVEGRTMWLGSSWRFAEKPREFDRDPNVEYLQWPPKPDLDFVSPAILELTGGGTAWGFWVKPSSPEAERRVANQWNLRCLESLRGCDSVCDLLPQAAPFFKDHRELAPKGGGWDETSQNCKHNPYEGRY